MQSSHLRFAVLLAGTALAFGSPAGAQPRPKQAPVTRADIDRLERKIEDQQRLLDKLVKLQKQYLESLSAIFEGGATTEPKTTAAVEPKPVEPKPTEPKPTEPKVTRADPKPKPVPVPKPKPKSEGLGTVVGKITGVGDAIVYIEDIVVTTRGSASMKQEGKQFVPQTLVVQKGTTVAFPNMDAIFHNVFSVTPDNSFDLGSYRQGESKTVTMSRSGVVSVYCYMHPQMVGHILVVPNGNFVRAGKDGFFRLQNVPAGKHRVVAWAPNSKPVIADTEVKDAEVVTVELELKKGRGTPHSKKDGLPYGSYEK